MAHYTKPYRWELTKTELKVISLLRGGLKNCQIADEMNVTERTVKFHLQNIYEKFLVPKERNNTKRIWLLQKIGFSD